jgi:hypothetical protein
LPPGHKKRHLQIVRGASLQPSLTLEAKGV